MSAHDLPARLVLVRHAKSDYPWGVSDHDRPLNPRGRRDAPQIGAWLDVNVGWADGGAPAIRVSTARRAQLTWAGARSRLSPRWEQADVMDEERIYEADVPALLTVAGEAAADSDLVVLVGHNPGLAELVEWAATDDDLRREALAKFPTSAVAVLGAPDTSLAAALARPGSMRVVAFAIPRG